MSAYMLKSGFLGIVAFVALFVGTSYLAGDDKEKPHADNKDHVIARPDDIKWGPTPPGLPAGGQAAVVSGDPGKATSYVIRVKMPDGYKVPPHWHSVDENVTVPQGTLMIGKGEKFDA